LATVRIEVTGVALGKQRTWDADIIVQPTERLLANIVNQRDEPVYVNGQLLEEAQKLNLALMLIALPAPSSIPIPLVELVKGNVLRHITMSMVGTPANFPLDTYGYHGFAYLDVPEPLAVRSVSDAGTLFAVPIRVVMSYEGHPPDVNFTLYQVKSSDVYQLPVTFTVRRSGLS